MFENMDLRYYRRHSECGFLYHYFIEDHLFNGTIYQDPIYEVDFDIVKSGVIVTESDCGFKFRHIKKEKAHSLRLNLDIKIENPSGFNSPRKTYEVRYENSRNLEEHISEAFKTALELNGLLKVVNNDIKNVFDYFKKQNLGTDFQVLSKKSLPWLTDTQYICLPDPEFLGLIALTENNAGLLLCVDNVIGFDTSLIIDKE